MFVSCLHVDILWFRLLTHWGRVTHVCVHGKLTSIGSDNGLSPERHQAIIWTNAGILLIGLLGTNFSGILTEIHTFSLKKMHLKMSSGKCRPFCLSLTLLTHCGLVTPYGFVAFTWQLFQSKRPSCYFVWGIWKLYFQHFFPISHWGQWVNSLRPRQNGRHFADDIFKRIFLNENVRISIKISLKFVPKGPINNIPALAQIMAWRRPGDKPLSDPMMVNLPTHICVTRPQWVNSLWLSDDMENASTSPSQSRVSW